MTDDPHRQRKRKRLLVASVGVATVSFMALQTGCDDPDGQITFAANLLAVPLDGAIDYAVVSDAALPPSPPPQQLPPSGNLVAIPYDAGTAKDAALDALVTSGNLVAPPAPDAAVDATAEAAVDAASDGSAPKDAHVDTGIPASGNLLPPIGPR